MITYLHDSDSGPTWAGCVVAVSHGDSYSETYARCWDAAAQRVVSVQLRGSTHYHDGDSMPWVRASAEVDASPEVCALAAAWQAHEAYVAAAAREGREQGAHHARCIDAPTLTRGHEVLVVKGRKVPLGTRGIVRWLGERSFQNGYANGYGHRRSELRVGIAVAGQEGLVYTAASNLEIIDHRIPVLVSHPVRQAPALGTRVTTKAGVTGKVFWAQGERLGVKVGPSRAAVVWCNVRDLAVAS